MSNKGTYIVVLKEEQAKTILIGRLGLFKTRKGYYLYIGSAMGSGGVSARLKHHSKVSQKLHWHLDYLRAVTEFCEAYALVSPERKECDWSALLAKSDGVSEPMKGFGSSDCKCSTHLFYFSSYKAMKRAIRSVPMARKVKLETPGNLT